MDAGTSRTTSLPVSGPYDLREVALMGFGHRDEASFDGAMRMAFCLDGDHERQVGVEARQQVYGFDHRPTPAEMLALGETWRPFRTWVSVMLRALAGRTAS